MSFPNWDRRGKHFASLAAFVTILHSPALIANILFGDVNPSAKLPVTQVYVGLPPETNEPPRRLLGWAKAPLAPGESKTVSLDLEPRLLSIFNVEKDDWELAPGDYRVFVGGSSRETPLTGEFRIVATETRP